MPFKTIRNDMTRVKAAFRRPAKNTIQVSAGLIKQVEEYIDKNYVSEQIAEECGAPGEPLENLSEPRRRRRLWEREPFAGSAEREPFAGSALMKRKASLEDVVNRLGESFQARLLRMIDERGMSDPEVYKRANVDRKLFSKIRCSEDYIPKKKTIVALAIALRLNLDDTKDLLASAGLALTNNSKADLIVSFCIENEIYDIFEVNALLSEFHQPILG